MKPWVRDLLAFEQFVCVAVCERVWLLLAFQRRSFRLPAHCINPLHDTLGPLNARINQLVRPCASLWSSEQVICRLHVQTRKNRCHDSDHSFSAFVHLGTIPCSLCVRHRCILSAYRLRWSDVRCAGWPKSSITLPICSCERSCVHTHFWAPVRAV